MPGTCPVGQEVEMEDNYREVKKAEPCLKLIHMDQVEVEEIEWLFYPFIPYGKVTIIQGDPGEGKTTVVLQIIAKLTKGEAILSETSEGKSEEAGVEPINVIYQTAEDGLGDTIKPRLLAAGADCSRVLVIDDQDQPLTMVDARLEEAIIQTKARLVVLDPIQGFLGAGVDMHRATFNNSKSFKLGKSEIDINLSKDAVLVCAWSEERFINALLKIGKNVGNKFEYKKINHMATYIYPLGLAIVYNGNHSILSGILKGEGVIQANQTYDLEPTYDYMYFDGVYFRNKDNDEVIYKVRRFEIGILYEIGRLLAENGIR